MSADRLIIGKASPTGDSVSLLARSWSGCHVIDCTRSVFPVVSLCVKVCVNKVLLGWGWIEFFFFGVFVSYL